MRISHSSYKCEQAKLFSAEPSAELQMQAGESGSKIEAPGEGGGRCQVSAPRNLLSQVGDP